LAKITPIPSGTDSEESFIIFLKSESSWASITNSGLVVQTIWLLLSFNNLFSIISSAFSILSPKSILTPNIFLEIIKQLYLNDIVIELWNITTEKTDKKFKFKKLGYMETLLTLLIIVGITTALYLYTSGYRLSRDD